MTKEELSMRKQRLKEKSLSLCKRCEVMIKIANRRNKEDAEENHQADSLKNSKHVNESTKSDHVFLQAE